MPHAAEDCCLHCEQGYTSVSAQLLGINQMSFHIDFSYNDQAKVLKGKSSFIPFTLPTKQHKSCLAADVKRDKRN
jgi:hypothetical protein